MTRSPHSVPCLLLFSFTLGCGSDDESACVKKQESFIQSEDIGSLTDASDGRVTARGTFDGCNNEDYFHYTAFDDDVFNKNRPKVELHYDGSTDAKIEACVYVACYAGATDLTGCATADERYFPIESRLGFRGCCRVGTGSLEIEYTCTTGLTSVLSDDTADFFLHACAQDVPEATSYDLTATF